MITFKSVLSTFVDNKVYNLHIPVPRETIADMISGGKENNIRVICSINEKVSIHSSLMPRQGDFFILINKKLQNKLKIEVGDDLWVKLELDTSDYGMEMPEELAVLLEQDHEGDTHFHNLTSGKQRSLIYIVNQVKNKDSRMRKALAIVDCLNEMNGHLDYKRINEKIKEYNQMSKLR
ncbi:MAG: YdeI/OmpD-associated family protein [Cyclobacteriaceae bacterium]